MLRGVRGAAGTSRTLLPRWSVKGLVWSCTWRDSSGFTAGRHRCVSNSCPAATRRLEGENYLLGARLARRLDYYLSFSFFTSFLDSLGIFALLWKVTCLLLVSREPVERIPARSSEYTRFLPGCRLKGSAFTWWLFMVLFPGYLSFCYMASSWFLRLELGCFVSWFNFDCGET